MDTSHNCGYCQLLSREPPKIKSSRLHLCSLVLCIVCSTAPGLQGFQWAIDHVAYQARVASLPYVFEEARKDLGRDDVDPSVVTAVWNRIIPGLLSVRCSPGEI